ncbi:hypothetical protein BZL43_01925 [Pseudomonas sp. PICF141]|nr:hypothetical protein BZL43_01925 [Pseudomonas sp. PICF141]
MEISCLWVYPMYHGALSVEKLIGIIGGSHEINPLEHDNGILLKITFLLFLTLVLNVVITAFDSFDK